MSKIIFSSIFLLFLLEFCHPFANAKKYHIDGNMLCYDYDKLNYVEPAAPCPIQLRKYNKITNRTDLVSTVQTAGDEGNYELEGELEGENVYPYIYGECCNGHFGVCLNATRESQNAIIGFVYKEGWQKGKGVAYIDGNTKLGSIFDGFYVEYCDYQGFWRNEKKKEKEENN